MTQKHTPEPWFSGQMGDVFSKRGNWMIAQMANGLPNNATEANAERIVACVNAMAGIEDPEKFVKETILLKMKAQAVLEQNRENALLGQAEMDCCHNEIIELKQERDKLKSALKSAIKFIRCSAKIRTQDEYPKSVENWEYLLKELEKKAE